jgi:3-oxoacyl-[acyl-carrier-protein] synthase-3
VPEQVLTNLQMKEAIGPLIDPGWTKETLGINERGVLGDKLVLDLAIQATSQALEDANVSPLELGLIIVGTSKADIISPASACFLQGVIGATCPAFDMTSVCASFMHALIVASKMVKDSNITSALVVGADDLGSVPPESIRDAVYFGAGAGAIVMTPDSSMLAGNWGTRGEFATAWTMTKRSWQMNGSQVYDLAVEYMTESINLALVGLDITMADIDHVIPHQPSIQILKEVARKLDIPFSKFHTHMDKYANTGAASVPLGLDLMNKSGKLKKGDIVVLSAVGAGWSWGTVVMEW